MALAQKHCRKYSVPETENPLLSQSWAQDCGVSWLLSGACHVGRMRPLGPSCQHPLGDQPFGRPGKFGCGEADAEGELVEEAFGVDVETEELAATAELAGTVELVATEELATTGVDVVTTGRVADLLLGLGLELGAPVW